MPSLLRYGKAGGLQILRCQGLAVVYYGFALGRLGSGAMEAFAAIGFTLLSVRLMLFGLDEQLLFRPQQLAGVVDRESLYLRYGNACGSKFGD